MKKYLFSPGPVKSKQTVEINYHHRSNTFKNLYAEKCNIIKAEYFTNDYDVLLTQGSGTSAIEVALNGYLSGGNADHTKYVLVLTNGSFGHRLYDICKTIPGKIVTMPVQSVDEALHVLQSSTVPFDVFCGVAFETSSSTYNNLHNIVEYCNGNGIITIIDMVSALGYYAPPHNATAVCSSTAKVLRGLPVLGIVAYRKDSKPLIGSSGYYLNMKRYIESKKDCQTPHTSMIPQLQSINSANFFDRECIDANCEALSVIDSTTCFTLLGERYAPVLTFKFSDKALMKRVIKALKKNNMEIYFNSVYMKDKFQIGMFGHNKKAYKKLNKIIKKICRK